MPKFTKEDAPLFIGIVSDLFPNHSALIRRYYDLGLGGGAASAKESFEQEEAP